jgi:tetratricopeptide (TPR) repeat protein
MATRIASLDKILGRTSHPLPTWVSAGIPARMSPVPMRGFLFVAGAALLSGVIGVAQQAPDKASQSDREAEVSSSRDNRIDISPPRDDAKSHPYSASAVADLTADEDADSDIQEVKPWNPMKALKNVEVGDFYFKRKNYRAALDRYKEALYYKDNDAMASLRLAECQEKLGDKAEAKKYYQQYLKILPEGEFAKEAQTGLDRLEKSTVSSSK